MCPVLVTFDDGSKCHHQEVFKGHSGTSQDIDIVGKEATKLSGKENWRNDDKDTVEDHRQRVTGY